MVWQALKRIFHLNVHIVLTSFAKKKNDNYSLVEKAGDDCLLSRFCLKHFLAAFSACAIICPLLAGISLRSQTKLNSRGSLASLAILGKPKTLLS